MFKSKTFPTNKMTCLWISLNERGLLVRVVEQWQNTRELQHTDDKKTARKKWQNTQIKELTQKRENYILWRTSLSVVTFEKSVSWKSNTNHGLIKQCLGWMLNKLSTQSSLWSHKFKTMLRIKLKRVRNVHLNFQLSEILLRIAKAKETL